MRMKELRGQRCYSENVRRQYQQAYLLGPYYSSTEVRTMHNEENKEQLYKTNRSEKLYRRIIRRKQTSNRGVLGMAEQRPKPILFPAMSSAFGPKGRSRTTVGRT